MLYQKGGLRSYMNTHLQPVIRTAVEKEACSDGDACALVAALLQVTKCQVGRGQLVFHVLHY